MKYDFLIVGAGPFGAAFARTAMDAGRTCLVIDRREHVAGNVFTKYLHGIHVHWYGAHIFHTSSDEVWRFVNRFGAWRPFTNNPRFLSRGQVYSFPINLMTLHQLWGVVTPAEAAARLREVCIPCANPKSAKDWLLAKVGPEVYEIFFESYTQKQWFKDPADLPSSIVKRLPIRLTYNDGYFEKKYQAIPVGGYTRVFEHMLEGTKLDLGVDFFSLGDWRRYAKFLVFTGPIDMFHDHAFGRLEYRTLRFETQVKDLADYQGHAVFNHGDSDVPYLRSVEHRHFEPSGAKHYSASPPEDAKTVVTYDHPLPPECQDHVDDPQYPLGDDKNRAAYKRYAALAPRDILFGGRLGEYRYYDIDQALASAISKAKRLMEMATP